MRAAIVLVCLALLVPGAQACKTVPLLDIVVEDEVTCQDGCEELPTPLDPRVFDVRVYWQFDVDECTIQGGVLQDEMMIRFSPTQSNPAWLGFSFEPATVSVPIAQYYDPQGDMDPQTGTYTSAGFVETQLTVTFERLPEGVEWDRIEGRDGEVATFMKAHAEGQGFSSDAFGVEQISFDGDQLFSVRPEARPAADGDVAVPAPALSLLAAALLGAAVGRRRS